MSTVLLGKEGEKAAARYLIQNGYDVIKTNYRVAGSEVDIIAQKGDTLCFIEVKTRETDDYGQPEEFVDSRKRWRIIRAAKIFTGKKVYEDFYVRFDIISVINENGEHKINHIQHAFDGS